MVGPPSILKEREYPAGGNQCKGGPPPPHRHARAPPFSLATQEDEGWRRDAGRKEALPWSEVAVSIRSETAGCSLRCFHLAVAGGGGGEVLDQRREELLP